MYFAFTTDQLEVREAVRTVLRGECTPAVLRSPERPVALWGLLAELGVLGINQAEAVGGMGLGPTSWVLVLEEAGRSALPMPLIETVALNPMLDGLSERVARGAAIVTVGALDGYVIDADVAAEVYLCDPERLFRVVQPRLEPHASVDPRRRLFSVEGERVPVGGGEVFERAVLAASAELIGLARAQLDMAVAYAKSRQQFGRPIGAFQAVQHQLADALLAVSFAAPAVYRAAWSLEVGAADAAAHVSMAKALASDAAREVRRTALQVHGAMGYTLEVDLQIWMKRSIALECAWGDARWHRARVGDAILGEAHA